MRATLVKIGNSRGIRIPKALLEQCSMEGEVEIQIKNKTLVIESVKSRPRMHWDKDFQKMAETGDDKLLIEDFPTSADKDWQW